MNASIKIISALNGLIGLIFVLYGDSLKGIAFLLVAILVLKLAESDKWGEL